MQAPTVIDDLPLTGVAAGAMGPAWVADIRNKGVDGFKAKGLPHKRVEAFKYTDLRGLGKIGFAPAENLTDAEIPGGILGLEGHHIVLVNGHISDKSAPGDLPDGLTVRPLAEVLDSNPESIEGILCSQCDRMGDLRMVGRKVGVQ